MSRDPLVVVVEQDQDDDDDPRVLERPAGPPPPAAPLRRPLGWRDLFGAYMRAVNVVSSVAIEHPEWSAATREYLVEQLYHEALRRRLV